MHNFSIICVEIEVMFDKGAFTQSVLSGVIRRRLGYLINKKCFFSVIKRPFYAAYSALV